MQGYIQEVSEKHGQGARGPWTMYNITVDGTRYGCGFTKPNAVQGDFVSFDIEQKGQYSNAVNVVKATAPAGGAAPATGSGGGAPQKATSRDVSIQYQSSRKDAIQTLAVLLDSEAIKLPAKQADKYDVAMGILDELTSRFYLKLEDVIAEGGVSVEDLVPSPENG